MDNPKTCYFFKKKKKKFFMTCPSPSTQFKYHFCMHFQKEMSYIPAVSVSVKGDAGK